MLDSLDTIVSPPLKIWLIFRLCNQGLVLELSDTEAAAWIREPATRMEFTAKLRGKIHLKDRQYNVVIPFFPILTDIHCTETLQRIEEDSHIQSGTISQIHWIKDPAKREKCQ